MRINKVFKKLIQYQITKINKEFIKINKMYEKWIKLSAEKKILRSCQQKKQQINIYKHRVKLVLKKKYI